MTTPEVPSPISPLEQQSNTEVENRTQLLQYLAGIFDVSGSISIQHNPATARRGESFALRLDLSRTNPTIVNLMDQIFPASSGQFTSPSDEKLRNRWFAKAKKAEEVIEALKPHLILKFGHLQVVDDFLALKGIRTAQESEEFKKRIAELNKSPIIRESSGSLPDAYVAGVIDAHGSILFSTRPHFPGLSLNVTVNNQSFVGQLGQYFDATPIPQKNKDGTIRSYAVSLSANRALEKLTGIRPHLRLLQPLADLGIEFQNLRNSPGSRSKYQARKLEEERILVQAKVILQQNSRRARNPR